MFFNSFESIKEIFLLAILIYFSLIIILRISGKRTIGELSIYDFIFTFTIGPIAASIITSDNMTFADGLVAIGTFSLVQYIVTKLDWKYRFLNKRLKLQPILLYYKGNYLKENLKRTRLTEDDILQQIRIKGNNSINNVSGVILETNGKLSIITKDISDKDLRELMKYK